MSNKDLGSMVLDILQNDFHRPIVNGKCNREQIEDKIIVGILSKKLPPLTQKDVDIVCEMVDYLIEDFNEGKLQ
jgi:hypothetical protein